MASTTVLPVELTEKIMDNLGKDRRALLACSKLASSWRPGALSRLFRSIQIRDGFTIFSFGLTRVYGATYFARLRDTMPHLLLYLRHLTFFHSAQTIADGALYDLAFHLRLPSPHRVEAITFSGTFDWFNALDSLATRFPDLRRLTIDCLWNIPPHALPALNATSWDIGLSEIADVYTNDNSLVSASDVVQISLKYVTLRMRGNCTLYDVAFWLWSLPEMAPNLQSIELVQAGGQQVWKGDVESFFSIDADCCDLVHRLRLSSALWIGFESDPQYNMNTFLGRFRQLRVLELKIQHRNLKWRQDEFPQPTGPFPSLERLNVLLHHIDPMATVTDELPPWDWHAVEEMLLLRAPRFNCFVFTITPFSPGRNALWRAAILGSASTALPGLHAARKLEVVVENT